MNAFLSSKAAGGGCWRFKGVGSVSTAKTWEQLHRAAWREPDRAPSCPRAPVYNAAQGRPAGKLLPGWGLAPDPRGSSPDGSAPRATASGGSQLQSSLFRKALAAPSVSLTLAHDRASQRGHRQRGTAVNAPPGPRARGTTVWSGSAGSQLLRDCRKRGFQEDGVSDSGQPTKALVSPVLVLRPLLKLVNSDVQVTDPLAGNANDLVQIRPAVSQTGENSVSFVPLSGGSVLLELS